MKLRIICVAGIFFSSLAAEQHTFRPHAHEYEKQEEKLLPEKQSETLIQRLSYIAIQTSPLWVPFLLDYLLDGRRAATCEAVASRINPESTLKYEGFEIKTQTVARIGLEVSSHALLMSLMHGKINEHGNYAVDLSADVVKQSLYKTLLFVVPRYVIPHTCAYFNASHHEGKAQWTWKSLIYTPAAYQVYHVFQEVERAKKAQSKQL